MKKSYKVNFKALDSFDFNVVLNVYKAFEDFMCIHEESMTIAEAERNWKKLDKLKIYIEKRFKINNIDNYIKY